MTLYAVVLTFSGEVAGRLNQLRDKYNRYVSYTIEPHLTLKPPFTPEVALTVIREKLQAVAGRTEPFTLVLNGVKYFEAVNNVAYVAIETKHPVIDLHADVVHALKGLVKQAEEDPYELERFTPHVTIAESIPQDVFPTVRKDLADYKIHLECEISAFSLYSGTWDGVWRPVSAFELSGL